jgi:hypothetical protein
MMIISQFLPMVCLIFLAAPASQGVQTMAMRFFALTYEFP